LLELLDKKCNVALKIIILFYKVKIYHFNLLKEFISLNFEKINFNLTNLLIKTNQVQTENQEENFNGLPNSGGIDSE
jgi:hypothetical protein